MKYFTYVHNMYELEKPKLDTFDGLESFLKTFILPMKEEAFDDIRSDLLVFKRIHCGEKCCGTFFIQSKLIEGRLPFGMQITIVTDNKVYEIYDLNYGTDISEWKKYSTF